MAAQAGTMVAARFASEHDARLHLDAVGVMHDWDTIAVIDAAMIVKDQDGKVHVRETRELTVRKGALRGGLITGIVGLIFPPSLIASVVAGGAIGGLLGRLKDTGVKGDTFRELASKIEPGQAVVVVLTEPEFAPQVQGALTSTGAELIVQPIDDETMKRLYTVGQQE
jgi:uncharacterized membrane protein